MRCPRPCRTAAILGVLCGALVAGCASSPAGRHSATIDEDRHPTAVDSADATISAGPVTGISRHYSGSRQYQDRDGSGFSISAEITISGATVDTENSDPGQATMQMNGVATVTIINTRPDRDLELDASDASIVGYWKTPDQRAFCTPGKYCHLGLLRQPLTGYLAQQGYPATGPITMAAGSSVRLQFEGLPGRMELAGWVRRAATDVAAGAGPELLVVSLPSAVTNPGATWSCVASNAALTFDAGGAQLDPDDVMSRFGCVG